MAYFLYGSFFENPGKKDDQERRYYLYGTEGVLSLQRNVELKW
jgi:hypothetical protein